MLTGRCLCEAVAYEVAGELGPIFNCHCSKCRRWHGSAFRTRASVAAHQFRWVRGEGSVRGYKQGNVTKHFCGTCGSNLISTYANRPTVVGLPLGGLDQHPGSTPQAHIFVDSKSPWHEITDALPQHPQWPGDEAAVRQTSSEPPPSSDG